MSEHEHITRSVDGLDLDLTETDLARALATSLDRGHRLVRRRNQRRAAVGGLGAVALLAGGFGVISSLSDSGTDVSVTPAVEGTVVDTTSPAPLDVREAIAIRYLGEEDGRAFVEGMRDMATVLFTVRPDRWITADYSEGE